MNLTIHANFKNKMVIFVLSNIYTFFIHFHIVWRKVSIKKCKSGENCTQQEIENRQQLPSYQHVPTENYEKTGEGGSFVNKIGNRPRTNDDLVAAGLKSTNRSSGVVSKTSASSDFAVGSLDLVSIVLILYTSAHYIFLPYIVYDMNSNNKKILYLEDENHQQGRWTK